MDPRDEPLVPPIDHCMMCGHEWPKCTCTPAHRDWRDPRPAEALYPTSCVGCGDSIAAGDVVVRVGRTRGFWCLGWECGLRLLGAPRPEGDRG